MTYNQVTRAAADVPDASIGHRNKEGRVPGLELYNPGLCSSAIGSRVPGQEGIREKEAGLPREIAKSDAAVSWEPRGAGATVQGLRSGVPGAEAQQRRAGDIIQK